MDSNNKVTKENIINLLIIIGYGLLSFVLGTYSGKVDHSENKEKINLLQDSIIILNDKYKHNEQILDSIDIILKNTKIDETKIKDSINNMSIDENIKFFIESTRQ